MSKKGKVKMYQRSVILKVAKATDDGLAALAFQIEGEVKRNITENEQVDTGFMRSSVYTVTKKGSGHSAAQAGAMSKTFSCKRGRAVSHADDMAPARALPSNASAGVIVGANYAIYQEVDRPFLFPAADKVSKMAKGTLEGVYKKAVKDG